MITEGTASNIVYGIMRDFGLPVYQGRHEYSSEDRVVIHSHKQTRSAKWMKNYLEENVVVKDEGNMAKTALLKSYEARMMDKFYADIVGEYEGIPYVVTFESMGIEEDTQTGSHFVNCKILFSALR